jgi:hypothetical protein
LLESSPKTPVVAVFLARLGYRLSGSHSLHSRRSFGTEMSYFGHVVDLLKRGQYRCG